MPTSNERASHMYKILHFYILSYLKVLDKNNNIGNFFCNKIKCHSAFTEGLAKSKKVDNCMKTKSQLRDKSSCDWRNITKRDHFHRVL